MQVVVKNLDNKDVSEITLNDDVFAKAYRADILHRVVMWQLAKSRLGCHKTKERAEVSFSTRKLYKQKGTGRARHGSRKAPIFVGGGTVFGPRVRSHEYSLNKKVRSLGLKIALSFKLRENNLTVIDSATAKSSKTSAFAKQMKKLASKSVLIIDDVVDQNLLNSASNLAHVNVLPVIGVNVYDLLNHQSVLITQEAVKKLEERLA